jgi:hypothetical protein
MQNYLTHDVIKIMVYGTTAHNRSVYASPPVGGSASATARSFASLIPTPLLRHILAALEMLRISLFGPSKRRKQPERYVPFVLKFCKNILLKNG